MTSSNTVSVSQVDDVLTGMSARENGMGGEERRHQVFLLISLSRNVTESQGIVRGKMRQQSENVGSV